MTVTTVYIEGKIVSRLDSVTADAKSSFLDNCSINSSANIIIDSKTKKETRTGSQTECGLLQYVKDH